MKKIVSLITIAAMLAVSAPATASGRHHDYRWGVDHGGRSHPGTYRSPRRNDRGVSTGGAIAIGLGALILGAAIGNSNRNGQDQRYDDRDNYRYNDRYDNRNRPRQSQYVCQDVVQYDYYGNPYVAGRNCWYQ